MKIEIENLDRQGCHDLLTSSIAPLPIAWISTVAEDGIYNAAPFSMVVFPHADWPQMKMDMPFSMSIHM